MKRSGPAARLPLPFRVINQRVAFLGLMALAIGLMVFGKTETPLVEAVRTRVIDAFVPVLDLLSRPASGVAWVYDRVSGVALAHSENSRLRAENEQLRRWEEVARRLQAENQSLREMLNLVPDGVASAVTARVIGDATGTYARSLLVAAGARVGVARGNVAVAAEGLIGRVSDVGDRGARVLLITDVASQVPVTIEGSRQRAILAGDNSDRPRLVLLGPAGRPQVGERVVTSGHGGLFPAGLPVGIVVGSADDQPRVAPLVDLARLEHVRVVDFGIQGLLPITVPPPSRRGAR